MNKKRGSYSGVGRITVLLILTISCDHTRVAESDFDAALLNQHVEADVTFTERYRPQYHYTPIINWMNDPNGLVYYEGEYHLFHQYNPFGNTWGYMSWNHAVSDDLVHWEHRPVAILYGKEEEEAIFSGSAVVDHENTTEFGDDSQAPIVAVYTSHYTLDDDSTDQAQSLAYSVDGGESFVKYEGNPVIEHEDPDFRDPNVFWHDESGRWVMVVALPRQRKVQFYGSPNLREWEHLSDFGPAGAVDGIWECPDIFELAIDGETENTRWVLHVDMNPGAIAGGSGSQYFIGDFDGTTFTPDPQFTGNDILWTDYGTDFYAAISWSNIPENDGRRIWIGWMNNWKYANEIPTSPWRSAQSVPRSLELAMMDGSPRLIQQPVEELQQLRGDPRRLENISISEGNILLENHDIHGKAYEMKLTFDAGQADEFGLMVRTGDDEQTRIGYHAEGEVLYVDRTESGDTGFSDSFASVSEAPLALEEETLELHILVDWSSVEVFVDDGSKVITKRIFPDPESDGIALFSKGGAVTVNRLDFWPLSSVWN